MPDGVRRGHTNYMADTKHKSAQPERGATASQGERRRLARITHDDRGTARVEWAPSPTEVERTPLALEDNSQVRDPTPRSIDTGPLAIKSEDTFNPYTRVPETERKRGSGTRTDLRKLSAWIKLMRELEEAKKRGD